MAADRANCTVWQTSVTGWLRCRLRSADTSETRSATAFAGRNARIVQRERRAATRANGHRNWQRLRGGLGSALALEADAASALASKGARCEQRQAIIALNHSLLQFTAFWFCGHCRCCLRLQDDFRGQRCRAAYSQQAQEKHERGHDLRDAIEIV